jgi:hypothetical protein
MTDPTLDLVIPPPDTEHGEVEVRRNLLLFAVIQNCNRGSGLVLEAGTYLIDKASQ